MGSDRVDLIKNRTKRVGEEFLSNEGYLFKIIRYEGVDNCDIEFENGVVISNRTYNNIKKGGIKNPYHKSIYDLGYEGVGKYSFKKYYLIYSKWNSMFQRCYSEKYQNRQPTYKGCLVSEEWHNFQNFAQWFEENYKEGYQLDKDILVKGNKIYSPETCCFVPQDINLVFTKPNKTRGDLPIGIYKKGNKFQSFIHKKDIKFYLGYFGTPEEAFQAYKQAKEAYIKELADKYKDQITEACYQALINYNVEITD